MVPILLFSFPVFLFRFPVFLCCELFISFSHFSSSVKLLVAVLLVLNGASFLFSSCFHKTAFHISLHLNTRSSYQLPSSKPGVVKLALSDSQGVSGAFQCVNYR